MGVSDPEIRQKFSEPRWLLNKHLSEKQNWPWWKRLIHQFQRCPICLSNEKSPGCVKTGASKEEPTYRRKHTTAVKSRSDLPR